MEKQKQKHELKHTERTANGKKYECTCGRAFGSFAMWEEHALDANAGFGGPELEAI